MYQLVSLLFFLIFVDAYAQSAKPKVIISVDRDYAPYTYMNEKKNTLDGIYVQIINEISAKMSKKYNIKLKALSWKTAIESTKKGESFGLLPPYKHPERSPWLSYSDPLFTESISVFCHGEREKWPTDYPERKAIINSGFSYPKVVIETLRGNNNEIIYTKGNNEGLKLLIENKRYCYINDSISILYLLKKNKIKGIFKKEDLVREEAYLGYSNNNIKYPYGEKFIREFNQHLNELKKAGRIEKLVEHYTTGL